MWILMAHLLPLQILCVTVLLQSSPSFCLNVKNDLSTDNLSTSRENSESDATVYRPHGLSTSVPRSQRPSFAQLESLLNQIRSADIVIPQTHVPPRSHYSSYTTPYVNPYGNAGHSSEVDDGYSYEDEEDEYDDFDDEEEDTQNPVDPQHIAAWEQPLSQQAPEMSPVSQSKWRTMGTRSGVDELRRARIASGAAKTISSTPGNIEAMDHLLRVNRDGDCKEPKPRLIQVKQEYPHPSKIYLPPCTILHQCRDDTGCCNAESLTCVPRHAHRVDLFFYTNIVGTPGHTTTLRIERLSFFNHTECGCEEKKSEILPRDNNHSMRGMNRGLFHAPQPRAERAPAALTSCKCPSKYAVRPGHDGSCTCDCFDKHRECLRLKKGKEHFNIQDRQCIQKSECKLPTCEFGSYLRYAGRCTKKGERFEAWNQ